MQNHTGPSDVVLAHYGVKGMKWGVRKKRDGSSDSGGSDSGRSSSKPKKQSRRQRRKEERRARAEAQQKRAAEIMEQAANNPTSIVKVRTQYGTFLTSGEEFVNFAINGGAFDISTLQIYGVEGDS